MLLAWFTPAGGLVYCLGRAGTPPRSPHRDSGGLTGF